MSHAYSLHLRKKQKQKNVLTPANQYKSFISQAYSLPFALVLNYGLFLTVVFIVFEKKSSIVIVHYETKRRIKYQFTQIIELTQKQLLLYFIKWISDCLRASPSVLLHVSEILFCIAIVRNISAYFGHNFVVFFLIWLSIECIHWFFFQIFIMLSTLFSGTWSDELVCLYT